MVEETKTTAFPVGSFAPVLTDELLSKYKTIISGITNPELKDAAESCLACTEAWYELPVSARRDGRFFEVGVPDGVDDEGKIKRKFNTLKTVPLEDAHQKELADKIPWMRELEAMVPLFLSLPHGTIEEVVTENNTTFTKCRVVNQSAYDLRNALSHLLWHAIELCLDREPLTKDILPT